MGHVFRKTLAAVKGYLSILCLSLPPSLRLSLPPSLRLSVSPSLRLSLPPSLRLSLPPSLRLSLPPSLRLSVFLSLLLSLSLSSCTKRDIEAERRAAISETFAKLRSCAQDKAVEDDGNLKLAIASVKLNPNETSVRLVAYTLNEDIDFDLPIYSLSRGRWVINEQGRAYLLDEQCREYKLKDRKSSAGQEVSQNGRIKLNPGQAFEVTLSFPRLPDRTRMGVLVYGSRALLFSLWDKSQ